MTERDGSNDENLRMSYQTLCASYNAIDGIRGQLLGYLPLASSGIFLLLNENKNPSVLSDPKLHLHIGLPIGLFGFLITLGLYIFEIYGTRRCTHLIILGQHLEDQLKIEGQFRHRPLGLQPLRKVKNGDFCSLISEPLAAGVIYPTVGASWLYLWLHSENSSLALAGSLVVFLFGLFTSCIYSNWLTCVDVVAKRAAINASKWG